MGSTLTAVPSKVRTADSHRRHPDPDAVTLRKGHFDDCRRPLGAADSPHRTSLPYLVPRRSTTKTSVSPPLITPPAPWLP
jgi:hypothetical protein